MTGSRMHFRLVKPTWLLQLPREESLQYCLMKHPYEQVIYPAPVPLCIFVLVWYFCMVCLSSIAFLCCTSHTHACLDWDYEDDVKRYSHDWPVAQTGPRRRMWQVYAQYVNATSPESRGRLLMAVQDARHIAGLRALSDVDVSVHYLYRILVCPLACTHARTRICPLTHVCPPLCPLTRSHVPSTYMYAHSCVYIHNGTYFHGCTHA